MDSENIISEAMRLLGKRKSKRKAEASRANGKLGGRPKAKDMPTIRKPRK